MRCPIDPQARPLPGTFEVREQTAHALIHINPTQPDHISHGGGIWAEAGARPGPLAATWPGPLGPANGPPRLPRPCRMSS